MTVVVHSAGFLSTVQDLGRTGFRHFFFCFCVDLDLHALAVANTLVGNASGAAGLEISFGHVRLRFADQRLVAWCGGDFTADVVAEDLRPGHV
ncbi:MAG: hypothetical protein H0T11_06300, partial [Chthoniobacterales bacterium]|nr:hypothetical protein [Chthoniobacterales bacterium]